MERRLALLRRSLDDANTTALTARCHAIEPEFTEKRLSSTSSNPGKRVAHELRETHVVRADLPDVYRMLVDPVEQLKWNSLYREASVEPAGPIGDGSHLTGRFKGSGRADVTFVDVVHNERFTHHSVLSVPGTSVRLGIFDHTYRVSETAGGTEVSQHVRFAPSAIGRLVAPLIVASFRRRLPTSFDELRRYAEKPRG